MPLRTSVLAAQINNLSDARFFAAYPVEWMSFVCNPEASGYLPIEQMQEIIGWISGPKTVLDVRGCSAEQIKNLTEELTAEALIVDLSQPISAELCEHFDVFRMMTVSEVEDMDQLVEELTNATTCDAFILDFLTYGIDGSAIFNNDFHYILNRFPVMLQADFDIKDVSQLLELPIKGLVIVGGNEEKVGIRSFEDVQELMEELEIWE